MVLYVQRQNPSEPSIRRIPSYHAQFKLRVDLRDLSIVSEGDKVGITAELVLVSLSSSARLVFRELRNMTGMVIGIL